MTKRTLLTLAILPLFVITSSGDTTNPKSPETRIAAEATLESPCELITESDVRSLFAIPEEIQIDTKDQVLTYPTCSYEWQDGKVTKIMQAGSRELHIKMPSELMVVMVKDAGESMYFTSIQVYKDIEPVDNVGDVASWGTKMAQLTFLAKGYMFHIHVKASNDDAENKAKAVEVANMIIAQL